LDVRIIGYWTNDTGSVVKSETNNGSILQNIPRQSIHTGWEAIWTNSGPIRHPIPGNLLKKTPTKRTDFWPGKIFDIIARIPKIFIKTHLKMTPKSRVSFNFPPPIPCFA
jgi:hypothetical protein